MGILITAEAIPLIQATRRLLIRSDKAPTAGELTTPVSMRNPSATPTLVASNPMTERRNVGNQAAAARRLIFASRIETDEMNTFLTLNIFVNDERTKGCL